MTQDKTEAIGIEPVAQIGDVFQIDWIGRGPIAPIINKHGLKVGDFLYGPYAAAVIAQQAEEIERLRTQLSDYRRECNDAVANGASALKEADGLRAQLSESQAEVERLRGEVASLTNSLSAGQELLREEMNLRNERTEEVERLRGCEKNAARYIFWRDRTIASIPEDKRPTATDADEMFDCVIAARAEAGNGGA